VRLHTHLGRNVSNETTTNGSDLEPLHELIHVVKHTRIQLSLYRQISVFLPIMHLST